MFKRIKLSLLLLFLNHFMYANNVDLNYLSDLAHSKTSLESNDIDKATLLFLNMVDKYPHKPDAYLQLSYIYYKKKIFNLSSYYIEKAYKYKNEIKSSQQLINLYLQLILINQKIKNKEKEEIYLKQLLAFTEKSKNKSSFYKKEHGKALFLLGIFYLENNPLLSNQYLSKSIEFNYKNKVSHMLLANYYQKAYKNNSSKSNRNQFIYHYRNYNKYNFNKNNSQIIKIQYFRVRELNDLFYNTIKEDLFNEKFN